MKRILILLAAVICLLGACAPQNKEGEDSISIVCTNFPPYDFARNIAGDNASVKLLVPPGSDTHSYDPTPKDIIAVSNADIFIYGGGESDEWANEILEAASSKPGSIIAMTDLVNTFSEELKEGMEGEQEEGADEHVWTSPKNAQVICVSIADALCKADEKNAQLYRSNLAEYCARLEELDTELRDIVASAKRKTLVFGDRFPFRYLTEEYGIDYYAAFPGCAEMTEPSAKTVSFLIDKVKAEKIPVVLYTEFSNHKICDTIAEATGAKTRMLHSCHNLTKQEFESGEGYIELMQKNTEVIKEALGDGSD